MSSVAAYVKSNRSGWHRGPWDDEPDRVEWRIGERWCCIQRGGYNSGYTWNCLVEYTTRYPYVRHLNNLNANQRQQIQIPGGTPNKLLRLNRFLGPKIVDEIESGPPVVLLGPLVNEAMTLTPVRGNITASRKYVKMSSAIEYTRSLYDAVERSCHYDPTWKPSTFSGNIWLTDNHVVKTLLPNGQTVTIGGRAGEILTEWIRDGEHLRLGVAADSIDETPDEVSGPQRNAELAAWLLRTRLNILSSL